MGSFLQLQNKNEANVILHNKQMVGSCKNSNEPLGHRHCRLIIVRIFKWYLASQEGFCSMMSVTFFLLPLIQVD